MNDLCADIGYRSINKHGEQLCGDRVEIVTQQDNSVVVVVADGLGSGVKANILSTLTSKIISTMIANSMSIEECVTTIAATLPVCRDRGIAYSTFTIIRISDNINAEIIQYDNPKVILLRDGKSIEYPVTATTIDGKKIFRSKITIQPDDIFVSFSDGAVYAGQGQILNYQWKQDDIITFLEENYNNKLTAKTIASLLADQCNKLYDDKPSDDTTVAVVKVRKRNPANLVIGPPANSKDDLKMMSLFFSKEGRHIVCGGTTAKIAAKFLGKEIIPEDGYIDPEIPPVSVIQGVDLVTEGELTVNKVLEYAKSYLTDNACYAQWSVKEDGASQIAKILFEEATDITFYVGKAVNSAYIDSELPPNIKINIVEELADCLKKMGKKIKVSFF